MKARNEVAYRRWSTWASLRSLWSTGNWFRVRLISYSSRGTISKTSPWQSLSNLGFRNRNNDEKDLFKSDVRLWPTAESENASVCMCEKIPYSKNCFYRSLDKMQILCKTLRNVCFFWDTDVTGNIWDSPEMFDNASQVEWFFFILEAVCMR